MFRKRGEWKHKATEMSAIDFEVISAEYKELIASSPREEAVQVFLENHCYLLLQARNRNAHSAVVSKPKFADEFVADFVMFGGCNDYWLTLVEIEKPSDMIFTKSGDYSHAFTHALRQIADWNEWILENGELFRKYYSTPTVQFEIIIGRRENLANSRHKLKALEKNITVSTFDSLEPCGEFGYCRHGGMIQREAITFPEYKEIYYIGTGKESYPDPWFLYTLWEI